LELFSTKGYDATSVREICEAAGITKPTLYHFFGSKDGVYHALVQGALDDFRRNVEEAIRPAGPALARLQRVARTYFDNANRERQLVRFIMALVYNPSSAAPPADIPKFYDEVVRLVASVIEEGVSRGELAAGPLHVRLLVLMGALGEAICGNLIVGRPELTPELADAVVETVVGGWRTSGGS
jgi:AcrR family transcriptional regulator